MIASDVQASEEEINFTMARNLALVTISLQHPIMFDQFDIYTMVKNDTLKKLKLGSCRVFARTWS